MDITPAIQTSSGAPAVLHTPTGTVTTGTGGGDTMVITNAVPANTPVSETADSPFAPHEKYKNEAWVAKIKSNDDLWDQVANLQKLAGQKTVLPDLDNITPEEREAFYAQTRPKELAAYKFEGEGIDPGYATGVAEMMSKHGITAAQGHALFNDYRAFEAEQVANATSKDGFEAEMKKSFGDKFDASVQSVTNEMKGRLTKQDQAVVEGMPNQYYGVVARLVDSMMKEYGANESGKGANKPGTVPPVENVEATRARLNKEIAALDSRPHSATERQALIDQRAATFK